MSKQAMSWFAAMGFEDEEKFPSVDIFIENTEVMHRIEITIKKLMSHCCLFGTSRAATNTATDTCGNRRLKTSESIITKPVRISKIIRILAFCYELLKTGKHATQRDVFYCLINDFVNQQELNLSILDCVGILRCGRVDLGIVTTGRGFIAGNLSWNGIDCTNVGTQGIGIGGFLPTDLHLQLHTNIILVIEKDCVFQQLCEVSIWNIFPCVVITGCGFPDCSTRVVLSKLVKLSRTVEVFGLVDYNPFGLQILQTYQFGSHSMGMEMFRYSTPIKWLALHSNDVINSKGVPLSARDLTVRSSLLNNSSIQHSWKSELQKMDKKVELQEVYCAFTSPTNVTVLHQKILRKEFI